MEALQPKIFTYFGGERNRCSIMTPNGPVRLTVPLIRHTDGEICYMHKWQSEHWHALVSAYRKTPYFDFYLPYFEALYRTRFQTIDDLNRAGAYVVNSLLQNEMPRLEEGVLCSPDFCSSDGDLEPCPLHPHLLDLLFEFGPLTPSIL